MSRRIIAGSSNEADLVINDQYVSAQHCMITELSNGEFQVADLGSMNGTWLVGVEARHERIRVVGPRIIPNGYRVLVGRTMLPWAV